MRYLKTALWTLFWLLVISAGGAFARLFIGGGSGAGAEVGRGGILLELALMAAYFAVAVWAVRSTKDKSRARSAVVVLTTVASLLLLYTTQ